MSDGEELRARADLLERIDRLTLEPERAGSLLTRVLAPFARLTKYRPTFATHAATALFDALEAEGEPANDHAVALRRARAELVDNIERSELVSRAHGGVPIAHAAWLFRLARVLERIEDALARGARPRAPDRMTITAPLVLAADQRDGATEEDAPTPGSFEETRRMLDLQLVAIDHVLESAGAEQQFLERRRRLLEGARRLLLDARGALRLDPAGARTREDYLAREIARVDALQAAGLDPTIGLTHQARTALRRGDRERLVASLVAIESFAGRAGESERAAVAGRALSLASSRRRGRAPDGGPSLTSALLGQDVAQTIETARRAAHARYTADQRSANETDRSLAFMAAGFYAPGRLPELDRALQVVDGFFEVGASLSPIRATELESYARLVRHPTREMVITLARDPADLQDALLEDPRRVLLDLAAGRLLAKRWIERATRPVTRAKLVAEVRVYVLDASGSMWVGHRAAMRDAIMLSEIATTMRRFEEADRSTRLSLYYAFFTETLAPVRRIANTGEALAAIGDVAGVARTGGTNIQAALEGALRVIREARATDPELARASIVLVTDGQSPLDAARLDAARLGTEDVAIGVSVIALGEENPILAELVATQRRAGERAFYHFIDDDRLGAVAGGRFDVSEALALPAPALDLEAQRDQLERALDELTAQGRAPAPGGRADFVLRTEGPRALCEARGRDHVAVERRFARWFPLVAANADGHADEADPPPDVGAARVVLATIAEVVGELGGTPLHRRADAVELLERLLVDARLSPGRWDELLRTRPALLGPAVHAVHTATRGAEAWFDAKLEGALSRGRAKTTGARKRQS